MVPSIRKHRDLTFIDINSREMLIISCDSCGAIGDKERDIVKVKPETVGFYTAQVALMELLAIGAKPITLVNNLSVEMHPAGEGIVEGIKKALSPINLKDTLMVTGSTEENFPMCQTAMGVTVIGVVNKEIWQLPRTQRGDIAAVVGLPKVGEEVLCDFGQETLSIDILLKLQNTKRINEILPVGSKGILYEADEMASYNNLSLILNNDLALDLRKSAGPSTCAVVSLKEADLDIIKKEIPIPVNVIGRFL